MNVRMTIVLAVLCAAVAGYLYWVPDTSSSTAPIDPPQINITNSDSKAVFTVNAIKNNGSTVSVSRKTDGWQIVAPKQLSGDDIVIGPAVAAVARLSATSVITPTSSDLSGYGLVPPQFTVIMLDKDQKPIDTLVIGMRNPSGGARYVQHIGDAKVYLVNDGSLDTIEEWFTTLPIEPTPLPDVQTPAPKTP